MLIKYSQNYNFPVFYFVSLEAGTVAFNIFRVMIPLLVDTSLDFGLFRVVRPHVVNLLTFKIFFNEILKVGLRNCYMTKLLDIVVFFIVLIKI